MIQHYCLMSMAVLISSNSFPIMISSLMSPRAFFPKSTADLALGLLSDLYIPAPTAVLSKGLASLSEVNMAATRMVCVILIPFRLSQISCFTLQQPQVFLLLPKQLSQCGDLTPWFSSPSPQVQMQFCSLSSFSPIYFILPNFVWYYVFFSCGQVLVPIFSWCSARSSVFAL